MLSYFDYFKRCLYSTSIWRVMYLFRPTLTPVDGHLFVKQDLIVTNRDEIVPCAGASISTSILRWTFNFNFPKELFWPPVDTPCIIKGKIFLI